MFNWLAAAQVVVIGGVLCWAGLVKVGGRSAATAARRSALRELVGEDRVVVAYRLVGGAEIIVAVAMFLAPGVVPRAAALAWCVGLLGYLGYARVRAPRSSCGCLGKRSAPVRGRSFGRAGLLVAAAVLATVGAGPGWWLTMARSHPVWVLAVALAEIGLVVAASPELDEHWLLPLRRWRVTRRHPLAGGAFVIPVASSVQQLVRSEAYRSVGARLRSDLLDSWDEGEWRIMTYAVLAEGRPATAVFAVPLLRYQPEDVRVVLVPDTVTAEATPAADRAP